MVVSDLFRQAEETILIAGYAVYQGQKVFHALAQRMVERPALKVRMFLDIQRKPGDTSSPAELVRRFAHRFQSDEWPMGGPTPEVFYDPSGLFGSLGDDLEEQLGSDFGKRDIAEFVHKC